MPHRICPWWLGYLLASPIRRLFQNPDIVVAPYVREGMTVLEPGPGMGFFTLPLAHRVGPTGRVVAVDVQPRMVATLKRRVARAGLLSRVDARVVAPDTMALTDLTGAVDFTLAFALVHELPAVEPFFAEVARASKLGASLLFAEPAGHVKAAMFDAELQAAAKAGFELVGRPTIPRSIAALMNKG